MKRRHEIERKRLPKIQREEMKAKAQHYRKSLRMVEKRVSADIERELMKEVMQENKWDGIMVCASFGSGVTCARVLRLFSEAPGCRKMQIISPGFTVRLINGEFLCKDWLSLRIETA